ncbi:MAG: hypothetical protein KAW12_30375 [Candidatus Aminicenantes bacterium]|nr:hypothetical protein [Candidatus Aminicenantes bacterium]
MVVKYKPTFTRDFNKIKDIKNKKEIYQICFQDAIEAERISGKRAEGFGQEAAVFGPGAMLADQGAT